MAALENLTRAMLVVTLVQLASACAPFRPTPLPQNSRAFDDRVRQWMRPGDSLSECASLLREAGFHCRETKDGQTVRCKTSRVTASKPYVKERTYRVVLTGARRMLESIDTDLEIVGGYR